MTTERFVLRGWHVGLLISGFFLTVIVTDVTFATLAYRSFPGEVSATPYEDGLAYNAALERRAHQEAAGWTVASLSDINGKTRRIDLRWTDMAGRPVAGLALDAVLVHPATAKDLHRLAFTEVAPGLYRADAGVTQGSWVLQFTGRRKGSADFDGERRFLWP